MSAIRQVRGLSRLPEGAYDMRTVMGSYVGKLSFREMCVVLKEQKGWRQVRDFFAWMKLQVGFLSQFPFFFFLWAVESLIFNFFYFLGGVLDAFHVDFSLCYACFKNVGFCLNFFLFLSMVE